MPSADAPAEVSATASSRPAANVVNTVMVSLRRIAVPGPLVLAACRAAHAKSVVCPSTCGAERRNRAFMDALNCAFRRLNAVAHP